MASLLEIIELANGDIVLQRADSDDEPLLTLRFSGESRQYIGDSQLEVARAMIQAGIECASELQMQVFEENEQAFELEQQAKSALAKEQRAAAEDGKSSEEAAEAPQNNRELGAIKPSDLATNRVLH